MKDAVYAVGFAPVRIHIHTLLTAFKVLNPFNVTVLVRKDATS
jgi:hypothetical protein